MSCVQIAEEVFGYGAAVLYEDPISGDWITVAGTEDFDEPDDVTEAVDGRIVDGWLTRRPSPISKLEEVEFELYWLKSQWEQIQSFKWDKRLLNWRFVAPDEQRTYLEFCAFISKLGKGFVRDEMVKASVTLTPSGKPSRGELGSA